MASLADLKGRLSDLSWLKRMDWFRGLRAATAISSPLLLGYALQQPQFGWAALGAFEAIIADKGGPYRSRIGSLGLLTLGGAAGCLLGTLVGDHLAYAVLATVLWCFAWTYLIVLGEPFASSAVLVQLIYICGLGAPTNDVREAVMRSGFLILGGLWAMLLSLFLWPIDPYRPARFAVSDLYRELASFLGSIHELNLRKQIRPALWHRLARHHQSRLRRQLEVTRHAVSSVRAESAAETLQGRNLVVLLESGDMLLARSVALSEYMEMTANQDASPCIMRGKSALLLLEQAETWISEALRRKVDHIEQSCHDYQARLRKIPLEMAQCMSPEDLPGQFLLNQISDATQMLDTSLESATTVRTGREGRPMDEKGDKSEGVPAAKKESTLPHPYRPSRIRLEQLVANWKTDSLMFRHAARVAVVCGINVYVLRWSHISHGYWMMLTSLIVLQPHVGGTFLRSLQRIGGTVAGGIFAALLAVFLHSQLITALALFPLAFFALAVMPLSYTLFCFFVTPTFVLAFLPYVGDWQLAGVRVLDTLFGAVIAMGAMAVLWPALERRRFGLQLQRSLQANQRYLDALTEQWTEQKPGDAARTVAAARRAIGLAHNDTEDSLDRLRLEPSWTSRGGLRGGARATEAAIAFVTYLRRFGQSITTLASLPGEDAWKRSPRVREKLDLMKLGLQALYRALGGEVVDWEEFAEKFDLREEDLLDQGSSGQRQLARMERQLSVMQRSLVAMARGGLVSTGGPEVALGDESAAKL
jgi:uncharacterized membrane protein YccC